MDVICHDLGIPRKQIKETKCADRFVVFAHKSWLKCLLEKRKLADFPCHLQLDDWPTTGYSWTTVHFCVYKKYSHKVIPLSPCPADGADDSTDVPLCFSQLLQYISQTNHQHLWKAAYKKYSGGRGKGSATTQSSYQSDSSRKTDRGNNPLTPLNLVPYDSLIRDCIVRLYGCPIVNAKTDRLCGGQSDDDVRASGTDAFAGYEAHVNLYPVLATIETATHFMVVHNAYIETTLMDCVTYSPAIMDRSHNKPLFLIYQLLQLLKSLHDRGLFLGNIGLTDIFLTENLWLNVMPRLEANVTQLEQLDDDTSIGAKTYTKYLTKEAYSVKDYCEMWCHGQLSNYDYLTILNNLSGRRLGCPGSHHIMPWVTDFTARSGLNTRDMKKSKYRLNKGDAQLDLMFSPGSAFDVPHHVSDILSEITYFVYMARRTPKPLLCKYVRPIWVPAEYPASIQRLQEWTPDECIPEFFSDALVFKSIHEDLPDLEVPAWASCPEDFITKHREALESQYVSERLHHWIDLNFGYKLTGSAAIKAKNVCLSLVNDHKTLCERGIVQLFTYPHPPKQHQTAWTSKVPPRIYSHNDAKRRLTRSSEDLSNAPHQQNDPAECASKYLNEHYASPTRIFQSPTGYSQRNRSPNVQNEDYGMERSTSYHMNVQKSQNQICLPKDYNPVGALVAVENMEIFLSKTFYHNRSQDDGGDVVDAMAASKSARPSLAYCTESSGNAFVNRMFSETYEASLLMMKDTKRIQNLKHQDRIVRDSSRNYKHILAEQRYRELQTIGCIIVELFLAKQMRPLGTATKSFDERIAACRCVLKYDFDALPICVQYPVRLLLQIDGGAGNVITEKGLPPPSAQQILQPLLNNLLFPFPLNYARVYTLIRSLVQFEGASKLLGYYTFFDCDAKNCGRYEPLDRTRVAFSRKIAECKVKACTLQIESLLEPIAYDQFNPVELILPHVIDLLKNDETSILAAWHLFDSVAIALGPDATLEHLLQPLLRLYDAENDERINFLNSNFDTSMKFTTSSAFKSRKTIKLYHHSFLLRLMVRFGLRQFLENFVAPLIEAVGGYKDPDDNSPYHYHDGVQTRDDTDRTDGSVKKSRSTKNLKYCTDDYALASSTLIIVDDKICGDDVRAAAEADEMFAFEESDVDDATTAVAASSMAKEMPPNVSLDDSIDYDAENAILKIIDQFDLTSEGSILDLRLNHSTAEEVTETTALVDAQLGMHDFAQPSQGLFSDHSFDEDRFSYAKPDGPHKTAVITPDEQHPMSPTIPVPTFRRSTELNTIDCEIGSKKSIDSADFLVQPPSKTNVDPAEVRQPATDAVQPGPATVPNESRAQQLRQQNRISEMSAESLIWLSHRLGPVLTARYLSRNLLKMLTLCYVGQENLLPDVVTPVASTPTDCCSDNSNGASAEGNLLKFSIADGRVVGDLNSAKVLECLASISALFGDQFVLLQYFSHIIELIALCKKRITASLEGGLISSMQLLKFLVPCLSDTTIMDQLHDIILKSIIHPIIRLLASSRCVMPSGFLARSVLARKLLDVIYVLAVRIGPEMTKEHLCVPALQRFFLIFDKAYGIADNLRDNKREDFGYFKQNEASPSNSSDDSNFIEIRREGCPREWCIKGSPIQISHAKVKGDMDSITPPIAATSTNQSSSPIAQLREKAQEEICDVFNPNLAHVSYVPFLKYLGEHIMSQLVKNLPLILNLCHEFEQPNYASPPVGPRDAFDFSSAGNGLRKNYDTVDSMGSNSFGTTIVGNRIDVHNEDDVKEIGPIEVLDFVTYKYEQINTARHLRGNWLAYWEHEIGRPEKDHNFNLKQIKLQTFAGHANSVRSLLCLDNENSFMSASKDKTVKLWSLRSEGDGSKVSACQFTYSNHRKSVHSLAFLESLRLTISCDSGVHLWDPFVGAQVGLLDSHKLTPVSVVKTYPAPSPLVLAGTAESTLKLIDARTLSYVNEWKVSTNNSGSVRCIAVSPSGTWIACGLSSGQLILFEGRTGVIVHSWKATDGELLQLIAPNDQHIISSSLDYNICVWSSVDGSLLYQMKSPPEPAHCILSNNRELLFATPGNRIGIYPTVGPDIPYSITKLRSETFKGVLTSIALLPLNRMLLIGGDSGIISLIC